MFENYPYNTQFGNYTSPAYPTYQPRYAPTPQPMQQQQVKPNVYYYVNGYEGASAFMLEPNSSVLLIDVQNHKLFQKSTDAQGIPKIVAYSYIEDTQPTNRNNAATFDFSNFVNINDFNALRKEVEDLKAKKKTKNENKDGAE